MRKLPEADRYYLIRIGKGETHLLYFDNFYPCDYHIACFPNKLLEMCSPRDGSNDGITKEEAEVQDSFYDELTCPTCLRMARGEKEE